MTTIHLTTELPHQVGDKLYVVSGRMQGDDEDVTFTLAAKDHEHAVKGFAESLAKSRNLEVNEMLRQIKFNWGDDYPYVTCVTEVGTVVHDPSNDYEALREALASVIPYAENEAMSLSACEDCEAEADTAWEAIEAARKFLTPLELKEPP